MPGFVYILKSLKTDRYYVGCSEEPDIRLKYHNAGKVSATRHQVPWVKVFVMKFDNMTDARKEEYRIKKMKSRKYIEELLVRAPR